jgi:hypothetical protein
MQDGGPLGLVEDVEIGIDTWFFHGPKLANIHCNLKGFTTDIMNSALLIWSI